MIRRPNPNPSHYGYIPPQNPSHYGYIPPQNPSHWGYTPPPAPIQPTQNPSGHYPHPWPY